MALGRGDSEREEAVEIQRALIASRLPATDHLDIACWFRTAEAVGGDLYQVKRLSDGQIGLCVMDVTGHGVPAAMVAAYMKRCLLAAEAAEADNARCRPNLILERLNADLIESGLGDCRPVAAVYAVYDENTGVARFARAGAPYPIHLPHGSSPRPVISDGPLLGFQRQPSFETVDLVLPPKDTLLLFSDGLEPLVTPDSPSHGLGETHRSNWADDLARYGVRSGIEDLDSIWIAARADGRDLDDATLVALHAKAAVCKTPGASRDVATTAAALALA